MAVGYANGQRIEDIIMEHAVMREAFRALVDGDTKEYCTKYGLEYDDVYRTIEEAIYERVEHMCYLNIMEGDLDPTRGDKLRMKKRG